jgi:hypothetical protein
MNVSPRSRFVCLCLAIWFVAAAARADETFSTLKVGGVTYTNVTVTMVTATDIYYTYPGGMGNAKLDMLAPSFQAYFGYDPKTAGAAEKARQDSASQYLLQLANVPSHAATNTASANSRASTNSAAAPGERTPADIQAEIDASDARVREIVNQPVGPVAAPPGSRVGRFARWFGGDAVKPDFNTVDVSKTQEFPYAVFDYVSSDLDRSVAFPTSELESNAMTKYFYTDLAVPKKKLTEDEMDEINRLYKIIGKDEAELNR